MFQNVCPHFLSFLHEENLTSIGRGPGSRLGPRGRLRLWGQSLQGRKKKKLHYSRVSTYGKRKEVSVRTNQFFKFSKFGKVSFLQAHYTHAIPPSLGSS